MQTSMPGDAKTILQAGLAHGAVGRWLHSINNGLGRSDVLISSAQVLALNASPVIVVPAPGAGRALEFLGAFVLLDFNSAAYAADAGEDLVFKHTDGSGAAVSNSLDGGAFDGTADALIPAYPLNAAASTLELAVNAPLVLHLLVGEWITGDSPLKVRTYYREVNVSELEGIGTPAVAA